MHEALLCSLPLPVCGIGSGIASDVVSGLLQAIAGWWAQCAAWFLGLMGHVLTSSTSPPVGAKWFNVEEAVLLRVAAPIALLALVGAAWNAVLHGDLSVVLRAALVRLPIAVLLSAAATGLVVTALRATDALSSAISGGGAGSLVGALRSMGEGVVADSGAPAAVSVLVAIVVVLGALMLWFELVVRAAAITVLTASLPIVLAAALWPPALAWARRVAETLGALIGAKAVIVLVLVIGVDSIAYSPGASGVLTGAAMLLLAAFAPYCVVKLVPIAEAAAIGHLEGLRQRAVASASSVPRRAASVALAAGLGGAEPSVDATGANPIPMAKGIAVDVIEGTSLDPSATFKRGRIPVTAVPAAAGEHVWERDEHGPRLVWKPPWHVGD